MLKRLVFFILPFFLLTATSLSLAEESFVMKERQWKEIYKKDPSEVSSPHSLSFTVIREIAEKKKSPLKLGERIRVDGFFQGESLRSFRLAQDMASPSPGYCKSCVKKAFLENPRVLAPAEVIERLKPGLFRIEGKVTHQDFTGLNPALEIEADKISAPV